MTVAVGRDGTARSLVGPASHVLREAPVHGLMIGVMVVTMLEDSVVLSVLGAALLLATSVVCAALSRSREHLREHVIDLWGMALVLIVFLPSTSASGSAHGHALTVSSMALFVSITMVWALARVWLLLGQKTWRTPVVSGVVTAAGLVVMAAFCR